MRSSYPKLEMLKLSEPKYKCYAWLDNKTQVEKYNELLTYLQIEENSKKIPVKWFGNRLGMVSTCISSFLDACIHNLDAILFI